MHKQKNIMIPVSTFVRQAAFMADVPVSEFVSRAVLMYAHQTMNDANEALCNANVRDRDEQDRRLRMRNDREQRKLRSKAAGYNGNGLPVHKVDTSWEQVPASFTSNLGGEPACKTGDTPSRIKGLIADYKGDFFTRHGRHTTLRDAQVWRCHRGVHGYAKPADLTDPDKWGRIVTAMLALEQAEAG